MQVSHERTAELYRPLAVGVCLLLSGLPLSELGGGLKDKGKPLEYLKDIHLLKNLNTPLNNQIPNNNCEQKIRLCHAMRPLLNPLSFS